MLTEVQPKLPMRNIAATKQYYVENLGFQKQGIEDYPDYLMLRKEGVEIHFFLFKELNPAENYGQIYIRTDEIEALYQEFLDKKIAIHPNGKLALKPWGVREFSVLDPDSNLITFGQKL